MDDATKEIIRETALAVSNATKSENSGLVGQFKKDVGHFKGDIELIKIHLNEQDKKFHALEDKLDPMLKAFDKSNQYKMVTSDAGIYIFKKAKWIVIVGGAVSVIWLWIKFGVNIIIKK